MKIIFIIVLSLLTLSCEREMQLLVNETEVLGSLTLLLETKKFERDSKYFYPGAPTEIIRINAEQIINQTITQLVNWKNGSLTEAEFWIVLEHSARSLSELDSEEFERGLTYMEDIMDIYGIGSSNGRLNDWRYGFDPS